MNTDRSRAENFFLILMLGALCTVSPFSIDMYIASFPQVAADMHTTAAQVSLSLSSYFVGLALGQIFYGPVLDRFGRKRPLIAGLVLYIAVSLACATTRSVDMLIVLRFVQALGGCAAMVASTAMVRDFFHVDDSAKIFSLLMLVLGVSPLLAPSVGSLVATTLGWQWIFLLLAILVAALVVLVVYRLPEGHAPDKTIDLRPGPILRVFMDILAEPQFSTYAFARGFAFAGLFVYLAGSPLIFMGVFGLSARTYGAIFALLAVGFIGASQVNILLTKWVRPSRIIAVALVAQVAFGAVFTVAAFAGWLGLASTLVLVFGTLASAGIANPNGAALALAPFARNAGSASALLGFFQMGIGAAASACVGAFNAHTIFPIAAIMLAAGVFGLAALLIGRRAIRQPIETDAQEDLLVAH